MKLDRSGEFLLTSDALSIRADLDKEIVPENAEQFLRSFDGNRRIEAGGATIICSHDSAQWDPLRKRRNEYG